MKFPQGITGFTDAQSVELPKTDGKQFKNRCFMLALRPSVQFVSFTEPGQAANYYCAEMSADGRAIFILLNAHFPYLAFASSLNSGNFVFIDCAGWLEVFSPDYHVLVADELNVPLDEERLKAVQLNEAERKQAAHWKPYTAGQSVFNHWD